MFPEAVRRLFEPFRRANQEQRREEQLRRERFNRIGWQLAEELGIFKQYELSPDQKAMLTRRLHNSVLQALMGFLLFEELERYMDPRTKTVIKLKDIPVWPLDPAIQIADMTAERVITHFNDTASMDYGHPRLLFLLENIQDFVNRGSVPILGKRDIAKIRRSLKPISNTS